MSSKYSLLLFLSIIGVVLLSTTSSLADDHQQPSKSPLPLNPNNVVRAGYWYYRSDFPVAQINSTLFTHLFAAFASVDPNTYHVNFPEGYEEQFQNFTFTVQAKHPYIKTLLSIGGGDSDPSIFAAMTREKRFREAFINSTILVARKYFFFGLSLNWQYPYDSDEMTHLGLLLTEWRAALEEEANHSGHHHRLLLTADVFYSSKYWWSLEYPIQAILGSLDWINVMSYDIYTPISSPNLTAPPAPLYNPISSLFSVDYGVSAWISSGVPRNFIVLGLPFYGRSWILVNENNHRIFSPARGPVPGYDPIPYRIIKTDFRPIIAEEPTFDPSYVTYYLSSGTTWIGYDGIESIFDKVRYARDKGLLGYFEWHVGDDTADWTLTNKAKFAWNLRVDNASLPRSA